MKIQDSAMLAEKIATAANDLKAVDTVIIDVRGRCSYTDFLVIASGTSTRHVSSIAEFIDSTLRQLGHKSLSVEGLSAGQWALIDLGDVIAHIFHEHTRSLYRLDSLWNNTSAAEQPQRYLATPNQQRPFAG